MRAPSYRIRMRIKVVNIQFIADFAYFPLKWRAGRSRNAAELTFYAGGFEGVRR